MYGLEEWGREWIPHMIAGILTPPLMYVRPVLTILGFIIFLVYEIQEYAQIGDKAYRDINQYAVGFFSSSITMLILRIFEVIPPP